MLYLMYNYKTTDCDSLYSCCKSLLGNHHTFSLISLNSFSIALRASVTYKKRHLQTIVKSLDRRSYGTLCQVTNRLTFLLSCSNRSSRFSLIETFSFFNSWQILHIFWKFPQYNDAKIKIQSVV